MSDATLQCSAYVWGSNGLHRYRCGKPGKYEEDGKRWCGRHLPSKVEAKRAARMLKARDEAAEWLARQDRQRALADATEALIEAALAWETGRDYWDLSLSMDLDRATANYRKAKGGP
jgi:hypothetical protein